MIQSLILAIYPILKGGFDLSFRANRLDYPDLSNYRFAAATRHRAVHRSSAATVFAADRHGIHAGRDRALLLTSFYVILLAAALVGTGSAIFHPKSSLRVARMASGGQHGLAQSLFQVGGNFGSSLGPLLAAVVIAPYGQKSIAWFALAALLGIVILLQISKWYAHHRLGSRGKASKHADAVALPPKKVVFAIGILLTLIFSKYFYLASIGSYFTFYLINKFQLPLQSAQLYLFAFLFAVALGTVIGGPVGDRVAVNM